MPPKFRKTQEESYSNLSTRQNYCTAWMNSTQQYSQKKLLRVLVHASMKKRAINSIAAQFQQTASLDTVIRAIIKLELAKL